MLLSKSIAFPGRRFFVAPRRRINPYADLIAALGPADQRAPVTAGANRPNRHCPRHVRSSVGGKSCRVFPLITLPYAHAAPSHSNEVSFRFAVKFYIGSYPGRAGIPACRSNPIQFESGPPHSLQAGMPALPGVPSSTSKRPRFYCAAEGNSSLADLSLKQWLLTAAYPY